MVWDSARVAGISVLFPGQTLQRALGGYCSVPPTSGPLAFPLTWRRRGEEEEVGGGRKREGKNYFWGLL